MSDVRFRIARPEDAARIQPLVHGAYRGDSARRGWTHEADLLDGNRIDVAAIGDVIADPRQVIVIAETEGVLNGCVQITDKGDGLAYLGMLSVDPALQANGLGRRLVAAAERHAVARFHATRMEMTVIVHRTELIAWYQRLGYRDTGEVRPFPMTDPRFGLPRRADLAFTVLERPLAENPMIRTERLILRPARAADLPAIHAVLSDPRATLWWSTPPHTSVQESADWLDGMIANAQPLDFVVEHEGRVIGKAGFWRPPEIGYILHPDSWGRGLAREAVTAVIDRMFATTDAPEATADVDPENAASIRLLEAVGFVRTGFAERTWNVGGVWKDSFLYALKRQDRAARGEA